MTSFIEDIKNYQATPDWDRSASTAKNIAENIIKTLDSNGNNKLDKGDNINSKYIALFGINDNTALDAETIASKISSYKVADFQEPDKPFSDTYYSNITIKNKELGKSVRVRLNGFTHNYQYKSIEEDLLSVNKDNVVDFINGYNAERLSREGLIEHCEDENGQGISMEAKKNIIKSMLEAAEELKETTNADYKNLKAIYEYYTEGDRKEADNFRQFDGFNWGKIAVATTLAAGCGGYIGAASGFGFFSWLTGPIGAGIGGVIGFAGGLCDRDRVCETIDKLINNLAKTLTSKKAN